MARSVLCSAEHSKQSVLFRERPFGTIQSHTGEGADSHVLACSECMRCAGSIGQQLAHCARINQVPSLPTINDAAEAPGDLVHCARGCGATYCSRECAEAAEASYHCVLCPCASDAAATFDAAARKHVPDYARLAARMLISAARVDASASSSAVAALPSRLAALLDLCDASFEDTLSQCELDDLGLGQGLGQEASAVSAMQEHLAGLSGALQAALDSETDGVSVPAVVRSAAAAALTVLREDDGAFSRLLGRLRLNTTSTRVPSPCLAYFEALGTAEAEEFVESALEALAPVLEALQSAPHVVRAREELLAATTTARSGSSGDDGVVSCGATGGGGEKDGNERAREEEEKEEEEDDEDDDQIDAAQMFPAARGIGWFVLQSAMNHACARRPTRRLRRRTLQRAPR